MRPEIKERIEKINRGEVPEGYKRSRIGVIPKDWYDISYREIFKVCSGDGLSQKDMTRGDIPVFGGNGISGYHNKFNNTGEKIVIGRVGAYCGVIYKTPELSWITDNALYIEKKHIEFNNCFMFFKLMFENINRHADKNAQPLISGSKIYGIKTSLPTIKEQQKIASILSTWDKAIELKEKLIEHKREQKKGLMQNLLTGKIRWNDNEKNRVQKITMINAGQVPQGYKLTKAGIIPAEWDALKAEELFKNYTNKKHEGKLEVLSATQERGIIPRSELDIDIKYDKDSLGTYKKVDIGDFVISLRSFQGGIEYSEYEGIVSPAYTVIRNKISMIKDYYRHYFKTENFIRRLNSVIYGIRDGKQIGFSDFSQLHIIFPPVSEQIKIAEIISHCDKHITLLQQELDLLKQQKKGLMQLLLTGKVRVEG